MAEQPKPPLKDEVLKWLEKEGVPMELRVAKAYVMDRGYLDFARLHRFASAGATFVIRAKRNLDFRRCSRRPVDRATGLRSDTIIRLKGVQTAKLYQEVSLRAGSYFNSKFVGRGVAVADYDRDGRPDLAISNNGGPAILLRNETTNTNRGIGLRLQGDGIKSSRNAIGSRVEVVTGRTKRVIYLCGGGSYLSSNDRQVLVGLGEEEELSCVSVHWPSGKTQHYRSLRADSSYELIEGKDTTNLNHALKP